MNSEQQQEEALSQNLGFVLTINSIFIALLTAMLFFLEKETISNFSLTSPYSTRICGISTLPFGASFALAALIFLILSSLAILRVTEFKEYHSFKYALFYSSIGVLLTFLAIILLLFELSCSFGILAVLLLIILLILSPAFIRFAKKFKLQV